MSSYSQISQPESPSMFKLKPQSSKSRSRIKSIQNRENKNKTHSDMRMICSKTLVFNQILNSQQNESRVKKQKQPASKAAIGHQIVLKQGNSKVSTPRGATTNEKNKMDGSLTSSNNRVTSYANYSKLLEEKNTKINMLEDHINYLQQMATTRQLKQIQSIKEQLIQQYDQEIKQLKQEIQDLCINEKHLQSRVLSLQSEKQAISKRAHAYLSQNQQLTIKITTLKQQFSKQICEQRLAWKKQAVQMHEQNSGQNTKIKKLEIQKLVAEQKIKIVEKKLNEYMFKFNEVQSENNNLQIKLYKNQKDFDQIKQREDCLHALNTRISACMEENQRLKIIARDQKIKKQSRIKQLEQLIAQKDTQIRSLSENGEKMKQSLIQIQSSCKEKEQSYKQLNTKFIQLQVELNLSKNLNESLMQKNKSLTSLVYKGQGQTQMKDYFQQLAISCNYAKKLQANCRDLLEQNKRLTQIYEQFSQQRIKIQKQLKIYQDNCTQHKFKAQQNFQIIKSLQTEVQRLSQQVIKAQRILSSNKQLQCSLSIATQKYKQQLQNDTKIHEQQLNKKQQEISGLKQQIGGMEEIKYKNEVEMVRKISKQNEQITLLHQEINKMHGICNTQLLRIAQFTNLSIALRKQVEQQLHRKADQVKLKQNLQKQLQRKSKQQHQLGKQFNQLQKSLEDCKKEKESISQQNKILQKKLKCIIEQLQQKIKQIGQSSATFNEASQAMITQIRARHNQRMQQLKNNHIRQLAIYKQQHEDKLIKLKRGEQKLVYQLQQLKSESILKDKQIHKLCQIISNKQTQLSLLLGQKIKQVDNCKKIKQFNVKINGEFQELSDKYANNFKQLQEAHAKINDYKQQINDLELRLSRQTQIHKEFQQKVKAQPDKTRELLIEKQKHEKSIEFLSDELTIWSQKYNSLKQQNSTLKKQLQKQKQKYKHQNKTAMINSKQLFGQNFSLNSEAHTPKRKQKQLRELEREVESSKLQIIILKQQNQRLEKTMTIQLNKRKEIIESLIKQKNMLYQEMSSSLIRN